MKLLDSAVIAEKLKAYPGWTVEDGKLHREFKFSDFERAIKFMSESAAGIAKMNHHPEWSNVYNRVTVDLTTHSAGGITENDLALARLLEDTAKHVA